MKNEEELVFNLQQRKPFKIIYESKDYGLYNFNKEKNRYEGIIGYIDLNTMYRAIKDKSYFIQAYEVKKN